jgi:hypothetical protein
MDAMFFLATSFNHAAAFDYTKSEEDIVNNYFNVDQNNNNINQDISKWDIIKKKRKSSTLDLIREQDMMNNKLWEEYKSQGETLVDFLSFQNYDDQTVIDDYFDIVENLVDIHERDEIVETIQGPEKESWFGGVNSNGFRNVGFYKSSEVESFYSTDALFCEDNGIEVYNSGELDLQEFIDLKVWYKYDFTPFDDIEMYETYEIYKQNTNNNGIVNI